MYGIIQGPLSKAKIDALFAEECVYFGGDYITADRIVELFGEYMMKWAEPNIKYDGYLAPADYTNFLESSLDGVHLVMFNKAGFTRVAAHHNYMCVKADHLQSDAGRIVDKIWNERAARQAAADAEEKRRMDEAKAKRAAARAARKAAKEAQQAKEKPADRAESQQA